MKPKNKLDIGSVYNTNSSGYLEVVHYCCSSCVYVQFLSSGFVMRTMSSKILTGSVKDPFFPSVFGVGYAGVGSHKRSNNRKNTKVYEAWRDMLRRSYSRVLHDRAPTYIGCSVFSEWHNFQVFAEWFYKNYVDGTDLDKDIKIDGNKVYGPDTCLFVSRKENSRKASMKKWILKSPIGATVVVYDLKEHCIKESLSVGRIYACSADKSLVHRGWEVIGCSL